MRSDASLQAKARRPVVPGGVDHVQRSIRGCRAQGPPTRVSRRIENADGVGSSRKVAERAIRRAKKRSTNAQPPKNSLSAWSTKWSVHERRHRPSTVQRQDHAAEHYAQALEESDRRPRPRASRVCATAPAVDDESGERFNALLRQGPWSEVEKRGMSRPKAPPRSGHSPGRGVRAR